MSQAEKYADYCNSKWSKELQSKHVAEQNPGPPPTAKVAIITCMDARLDVFAMFGLSWGESHVIRVGGGRAPDAIRSLIASEQVLGTNEVMIVHHTDCGFEKAKSEDAAREEVREGLGVSVDHISFMPITNGLEQSIKDDVQYLRKSPYVKSDAVISGWIYDTLKGTINQVNM